MMNWILKLYWDNIMGISYDSTMMIGNNYNEIANALQPSRKLYDDELTEYMEAQGLKFAPPWYDAEPEYWFVGIHIPDTTLSEIDWIQWVSVVEEAHNKLRKIVGPDLKLELKSVLDVW